MERGLSISFPQIEKGAGKGRNETRALCKLTPLNSLSCQRPLPLPRSKIRSEKAEVSSLAVKNPLGPTSCQRGLPKARRSPCRTREPNIRRTDISAPENRRICAGGCRQDKERGTKGREYNRSADRLDLESEGSSGPNQRHGVEAEQRNSQANTGGGGARPLSPPLWAGFSSQAEPHWSLRSPSTQSARRRVPPAPPTSGAGSSARLSPTGEAGRRGWSRGHGRLPGRQRGGGGGPSLGCQPCPRTGKLRHLSPAQRLPGQRRRSRATPGPRRLMPEAGRLGAIFPARGSAPGHPSTTQCPSQRPPCSRKERTRGNVVGRWGPAGHFRPQT